MARRGGPNMQPAVMTLTFTGLSAPAGGSLTKYLDLSQIACIVNRRFYRQGLNWAVAGFKILSSSGSQGILSVSKLHNTWVTSAAWEKAFRHWQKQQNEALDDAGLQSTKGKFNDFKILMDASHEAQYNLSGQNLNLTNLIPDGYLSGEWQASQVVIPNSGGIAGNTQEFELRMYGSSNSNMKGIVEGYVKSRAVPASPDPITPGSGVAGSWLSQMQDEGEIQQEVVDNAVIRNNELPYDRDIYPGYTDGAVSNNAGPITHDTEYITATTIGGTTRLKGGNFPCGLVKLQAINTNVEEDLAFTLYVDLVPGHHRGYLCESMVDM